MRYPCKAHKPSCVGSRAHTPQEVGRGSAASHASDSKQIKHIRPGACVRLCYRLGGGNSSDVSANFRLGDDRGRAHTPQEVGRGSAASLAEASYVGRVVLSAGGW